MTPQSVDTALPSTPNGDGSALESFVLRGAHVLDEGGGFGSPLDVEIARGVVVAIGRRLKTAAQAFDYSDRWLLPGFFDCHAHLAIASTDLSERLFAPPSYWTLRTAATLQTTLASGVTFVRDAGGADQGVRAAVEEGYVLGPRLQVAITMLSTTGGHSDLFLAANELELHSAEAGPTPNRSLVDGTEEVRKTVRRLLRGGADWIKVCATGGVSSPGDDPDEIDLTPDELATAVAEARRRRRPVMAHAIGAQGIENALAAGVRSIEHGIDLTEAQAHRMNAEGCALVPTLSIAADACRLADAGLLPTYATEKLAAIRPRLGEAVRLARAYDVTIAAGSDAYSSARHGRFLDELAALHEAGLTVEETLLAATRNGAQLCGVADHYGQIAIGRLFDCVAFGQEPNGAASLRQEGLVRCVFKAGIPVLPDNRLTAGPRAAPTARQ